MGYDFEIKGVAPTLVITHQEQCSFVGLKGMAYALNEKGKKRVKGSTMCLLEQPFLKEDSKIQVCCPIIKLDFSLNEEKFKGEVLQRTRVVSTIHQGEYNELETVFTEILSYMAEENLKANLPYRIIFHKEKRAKERKMPFCVPVKQYVTEIQVPILDEE